MFILQEQNGIVNKPLKPEKARDIEAIPKAAREHTGSSRDKRIPEDLARRQKKQPKENKDKTQVEERRRDRSRNKKQYAFDMKAYQNELNGGTNDDKRHRRRGGRKRD